MLPDYFFYILLFYTFVVSCYFFLLKGTRWGITVLYLPTLFLPFSFVIFGKYFILFQSSVHAFLLLADKSSSKTEKLFGLFLYLVIVLFYILQSRG